MPVAATNSRQNASMRACGQILGRVHAPERRQQVAVSVDAVRPRALGDQPEPALARREQLLDEREQREPVDRAQRLVASFAPDDHDRIAIGIEADANWPTASAERNGMSAPQANAASARSPIARIPAARPSSGPWSATASRATSMPTGSGGNSWPGAPTTTTGAAAAATARATWTTSGDPAQSRSAFGSPIRVDRPPASTIPPSAGRAGQRLSRLALPAPRRFFRGARRHALDHVAPDAQTRRRQERVQELPRRDRRLGGGGRFGNGWGGTRHTDPTPGPRGRNALGPGAGGLGGCWAALPSPFPHARVKRCPGFPQARRRNVRQSSCLGVRSFHSLSAISTRISTGRLAGCEPRFERVGEHLGGRHAVVVGGRLGGGVARAGRVADEEHRGRDVGREDAGVVAGVGGQVARRRRPPLGAGVERLRAGRRRTRAPSFRDSRRERPPRGTGPGARPTRSSIVPASRARTSSRHATRPGIEFVEPGAISSRPTVPTAFGRARASSRHGQR